MIYYDSETYPLKPGLQAPPVVTQQVAGPDGEAILVQAHQGPVLRDLLPRAPLIAGHFIAFDMAAAAATWPDLLPLIFQAYEEDRITCTGLREVLLRVAQGTSFRFAKNGLQTVLDRHKIPHRFEDGDKAGPRGPRVRYEEWRDLPVEDLPEDARRYASEDVAHGHELYQSQEEKGRARGWLQDEFRQARAAWTLRLISTHGFRVDQRHVRAFRKKVLQERDALRAALEPTGLVRRDGTRNMTKAKERMIRACRAAELSIPITDTGRKLLDEGADPSSLLPKYVSLQADLVTPTGDEILIQFARFGSVKTLLSRADRLARAGDLPIQTTFSVLKETGRTSSRAGIPKPGSRAKAWGDQLQNMNRAPGLRECYVPRPGKVLLSSDWSAVELSALAEVCTRLGIGSRLGEIIRAGLDPHMAFGATIKGWEYAWAMEAKKGRHGRALADEAKDARQGAKAANFGFPGGLGSEKFRIYAANTYGVHLTASEAGELRGYWFAMYPEMGDYFAHINALLETGEPLVHPISGRARGGVYYTNACNSYFQGLAADMAKDAGFLLAKECYVGDGVLRGARIVNFVHDEYILEVDEAIAHEAAEAVVAIMEDAGRRWMPSAPPKAEPALSRRWRKGADPVYVDGRLTPWEDRAIPEETRNEIRAALREGRDPIHLSWDFGLEEDRIMNEGA